jgi:two-component system cell cycle response regulator
MSQPPPGLRVLVVDDDDGARSALIAAVRHLGHECRAAADGLEAWEMHQAEPADVIISDWQMPRMDGLELCRRTRGPESPGTGEKYTYFIFVTSFADKGHYVFGMEAGADDYQTKPVDLDELRARLVCAARVLSLHRRLADSNTALRRDSEASYKAARIDPLTQVANRLSMNEDLTVLWARMARYARRCALGVCDIDRFKAYNDAFGHLAGDQVLRRVAQAIRGSLREGDGLYRYGGEEFVILLPEQSVAEAGAAAERVRRAVEALGITADSPSVPVTLSVGVAGADMSVDTGPNAWLERADVALYRAKQGGRNRVELDVMPDSTAGRSELSGSLSS